MPVVGDDGAMDVDDQTGEPPPSGNPTTVGEAGDPLTTDGTVHGASAPSVVEAVLYGPLGLALEARSLMPRLVQRGRNEVAMAKMVGQFAVRKGTEDLAAGALVGQEKLLDLLRGTGLFGASGSSDASSSRATDVSASPNRPADGDDPGTGIGGAIRPPSPSRVSAQAAEQAAGIDPADLAIVGYDLLSASQVVPRLESLTSDELDLVARYEAGTRGRKTILAKVAQLQSPPSPDQ